MRQFYKYQKEIFNKIQPMDRVALFIEMRLGKTLLAVRWAESKKAKRILILCPKAVMPVWNDELRQEGYEKEKVSLVTGNNRLDIASRKYFGTHFFICNFESIVYWPQILKLDWELIVVDESTRIRNPKADTTKFIIANTQEYKKKMILSGLPNPESDMDYFSQIQFLMEDSKFMGCNNFWAWRNKHCYQADKFSWEIHGWARKKMIEEIAKLSVVLSRKDAGIGEKKIYENRYTYMTPEQKKSYQQMMDEFETIIRDELVTTKFVGPKYEFMSQIASGITREGTVFCDRKFNELIYLLKEELRKESVVVWCRHTHEIKHIEELLNKARIEYATFYGGQESKQALFKSGKVRIMVAQPASAKYGIDWSVASTAIYFSNWWDGEVRAQSEDRIVHPEKKEPLLYIDLICKGTIEEDIVKILKEKKAGSQEFLRQLTERIKQKVEKRAILAN